jgi:hypothetical protein
LQPFFGAVCGVFLARVASMKAARQTLLENSQSMKERFTGDCRAETYTSTVDMEIDSIEIIEVVLRVLHSNMTESSTQSHSKRCGKSSNTVNAGRLMSRNQEAGSIHGWRRRAIRSSPTRNWIADLMVLKDGWLLATVLQASQQDNSSV